MAMLSIRCKYGLRAAIYVAAQPPGQYVSIRRISNSLGISFHFLTKILQSLTVKGILISHRGPHGGVLFARSPGDVTFQDIIEAIEGPSVFTACILGLSRCRVKTGCPLREKWSDEQIRIVKLFRETRLDTMAQTLGDLFLTFKFTECDFGVDN